MNESCSLAARRSPGAAPTRWSVAGLLLEAIAARDVDRMANCFATDATMRALLPRGAVEYHGVDEILGAFGLWFGDAAGFEVLDASVGDVGSRLHASWRLRVHPTPKGDDRWHVIEQHVYAHAGDRIDALDLLCSGFQPEGHG